MSTTAASRRMRMAAAAAVAIFSLAGCGSERGNPFESLTTGSSSATAPTARPAPAATQMGGRWILASPNDGFCGMNFGGAAGSGEGTIKPEGGCPGKFFTSRKWAIEQGMLVIRDHTGQPLAQLAMAASGRFEGQATTGMAVSLAR